VCSLYVFKVHTRQQSGSTTLYTHLYSRYQFHRFLEANGAMCVARKKKFRTHLSFPPKTLFSAGAIIAGRRDAFSNISFSFCMQAAIDKVGRAATVRL
jgi:hypothetical protein